MEKEPSRLRVDFWALWVWTLPRVLSMDDENPGQIQWPQGLKVHRDYLDQERPSHGFLKEC